MLTQSPATVSQSRPRHKAGRQGRPILTRCGPFSRRRARWPVAGWSAGPVGREGSTTPSPYSINPVEVDSGNFVLRGFSEVRRRKLQQTYLEAAGHTYRDAPCSSARHRDAGPGIWRARVVASRARAAFSGSRRGDGNSSVSGVSLTGRSFFLARSSLAVPQACRSVAERADKVFHEEHPFGIYSYL